MHVAILDDHRIVLEGLKAWLEAKSADIHCETFSDAESLMRFMTTNQVDAAIIDLFLSYPNEGVDVAFQLRSRYPDLGILLVSTFYDVKALAKMLKDCRTGVGYVPKTDSGDEILVGLTRVSQGEVYYSAELLNDIMSLRDEDTTGLTSREQEIVSLISIGRSNSSIARELGISVRTVEVLCSNIFAKLGITGDTSSNRRVLAVLKWQEIIADT